jgi:hypothetical protein
MSTTSKEETSNAKWKKWGEKGTKDPKIKNYIELLMKYNSTAIDSLKESREKLIKQREEYKNG